MELRSGRYIASGEARRRVELGRTPSGPDHISALSDDLLLLILASVRCTATVARTGVLAHRWRLLWTELPGLHFHDVPFRSIAGCFKHATSLSLSTGNMDRELRMPLAFVGECLFPPGLTMVDLYGYFAADGLAVLAAQCPRLRVLRYKGRPFRHYSRDYGISIHSLSLRELVVKERGASVCRVNVVAPALEQLSMSFIAGDGLTVSVVAPMAEKISWRCEDCLGTNTGLGCWKIEKLKLTTPSPTAPPEKRRPPLLRIDALTGMSHFHDMPTIEEHLEEHLRMQVAVDLSAMDLELHVTPCRDDYGALIFHLLGMQHVCSAARKLKLALLRDDLIRQRRGIICQFCELVDWRSQTISMPKLEEVEIDGFEGDDHDLDFLERVFRCAPELRRMAVKWSAEAEPSDENVLNVFKGYPSVECYVSYS